MTTKQIKKNNEMKKQIKKMKNKTTLSIKYVDSENDTSDGLYAIKFNSNRWLVGSAILSNKKIIKKYKEIETIIDNNWRREGFQYWTNK